MANMIQSINSVTQRDKVVDHIHIAAAMLSQSVNHQQNCSYILFRKPALMIYIDVSRSLEMSLDVFHGDLLFGKV